MAVTMFEHPLTLKVNASIELKRSKSVAQAVKMCSFDRFYRVLLPITLIDSLYYIYNAIN